MKGKRFIVQCFAVMWMCLLGSLPSAIIGENGAVHKPVSLQLSQSKDHHQQTLLEFSQLFNVDEDQDEEHSLVSRDHDQLSSVALVHHAYHFATLAYTHHHHLCAYPPHVVLSAADRCVLLQTLLI